MRVSPVAQALSFVAAIGLMGAGVSPSAESVPLAIDGITLGMDFADVQARTAGFTDVSVARRSCVQDAFRKAAASAEVGDANGNCPITMHFTTAGHTTHVVFVEDLPARPGHAVVNAIDVMHVDTRTYRTAFVRALGMPDVSVSLPVRSELWCAPTCKHVYDFASDDRAFAVLVHEGTGTDDGDFSLAAPRLAKSRLLARDIVMGMAEMYSLR